MNRVMNKNNKNIEDFGGHGSSHHGFRHDGVGYSYGYGNFDSDYASYDNEYPYTDNNYPFVTYPNINEKVEAPKQGIAGNDLAYEYYNTPTPTSSPNNFLSTTNIILISVIAVVIISLIVTIFIK